MDNEVESFDRHRTGRFDRLGPNGCTLKPTFPDAKKGGFTLIELMVVMAIIATLLAIAAPRYFDHLGRAREAALRETLVITRDAIDKFHTDTGNYPDNLEVLVEKRYLRKLPIDTITDSTATWVLVPPPERNGTKASSSVYDLHSGAPGNGNDGTAYADW